MGLHADDERVGMRDDGLASRFLAEEVDVRLVDAVEAKIERALAIVQRGLR